MATPIVDTHQHLWDLDRQDLPWLDDVPALRRHHRTDEYREASAGTDIVRAIYMEVDVAPPQRRLERELISELCAGDDTPTVAAVFGATPGAPEFAGDLAALAANPYAKGVRVVLQPPSRPRGTCLEPAFVRDVRQLGANGLLFDLCMRPRELSDGVELARHCPDTTFVLDHCGNADPLIVAGSGGDPDDPVYGHGRQQWMDDIGRLGELPNVVCKISGVVARVQPGWQAADLAPAVEHCLDSFAADRVVFGSDWPVCTLGAPLADWVAALRKIIESRPEEAQRQLLHANAERIYQL